MIKLYGAPRTSAGRCYWMLEELGLPYETVPLDMMQAREHKSPAFLKLNPNGKVPVLIDGDFKIWESMAINTYLVEKTKSPLGGTTPEEKGLIQQWSYWSILELQRPAVDCLIQEMFVPAEKKDVAIIQKSKEVILNLLPILNESLSDRTFLVGGRFTMADLNVASVVNVCRGLKIELSAWPNVQRWFSAISDRPAFQKLMKLRAG